MIYHYSDMYQMPSYHQHISNVPVYHQHTNGIPVHHQPMTNGHRFEDDDEGSSNKGGAVAKLLQDDLNWASKYLRSNSISRAPSVGGRSSVSPSRSQSVGRDVNVGLNGYGHEGKLYTNHVMSVPNSSLPGTERGSLDYIYPYRSGMPEPRRSISYSSGTPEPRRSVSYRSSTPEPRRSISSRSGIPESRSYSVERRLSYSRPTVDHVRLPTPTRSFEAYNAVARNNYGHATDMKPPNPDVSDTRRRLRRLVCQSRRNPHYYN